MRGGGGERDKRSLVSMYAYVHHKLYDRKAFQHCLASLSDPRSAMLTLALFFSLVIPFLIIFPRPTLFSLYIILKAAIPTTPSKKNAHIFTCIGLFCFFFPFVKDSTHIHIRSYPIDSRPQLVLPPLPHLLPRPACSQILRNAPPIASILLH